jgi:hypothetical protein
MIDLDVNGHIHWLALCPSQVHTLRRGPQVVSKSRSDSASWIQ